MTLFDLKTFHFEINIYFVFSFQIMVFRFKNVKKSTIVNFGLQIIQKRPLDHKNVLDMFLFVLGKSKFLEKDFDKKNIFGIMSFRKNESLVFRDDRYFERRMVRFKTFS